MEDAPQKDIRIDREGIWHYRGAEMHRKDIVQELARFLQKTENGYSLEIPGIDYADIDVEDTPFVVASVDRQTTGEEERIIILLSDGSEEVLNLHTLAISQENALYCTIREGKFPCRFLRKSYYQLTQYLEYDEGADQYFLRLNGTRYVIKKINFTTEG